MLEQRIQQQFFDSADLKYQSAESLARPIADATQALLGAITGGGKVMVMGSGQSAALAAHMAALLVGRFERDRPPLPAQALLAGEPGAALQLQALGHPGDVLLLLDAGEAEAAAASQAAVLAAHGKEMTVVLLAGSSAHAARAAVSDTDVTLALPPARPARVLEAQLLVLHTLCDAIDLQLLGEQDP